MRDDLTLYEEITKIAEDYFGPVAPRLISRIVINHLRKEPEQVTHQDLPEVIAWIRLAVGMVTEDAEVIKEFVLRLTTLSVATVPVQTVKNVY